MTKDLEYYLNHGQQCYTIPDDTADYLKKLAFLSEFKDEDEKLLVRDNLGITTILQDLLKISDSGREYNIVLNIQRNGQGIPTSGAVWDFCQRFANTEQLEQWWQEMCNFQDLLHESFEIFKDEINDQINLFSTEIANLIERVDSLFTQLDEIVHNYMQQILQQLLTWEHTYERRLKNLETQFTSLLQSSKTGIALSNEFGNEELIGITQNTLTKVVNALQGQINDIVGLPDEIDIDISPTVVIGKSNYDINVFCKTEKIVDKLEIYVNDEVAYKTGLFEELKNIEGVWYYTFNHTITIKNLPEATVRVEVTTLGKKYVKEEIVHSYIPYFLSGQVLDPSDNLYVAATNAEALKEGPGTYQVSMPEGGKFIALVPINYALYMENHIIPCDIKQQDEFYILTSYSTYEAGEYDITIKELEE